MKKLLLLLTLALTTTACYEDRIACLDPDASNYDLRADDACPDDCCTFPNLSVNFTRSFNGQPFSRDSVYVDGGGNRFQIQRLRFYLGDIQLLSGDRLLPTPENVIDVRTATMGDTLATEVNDNNLLITTEGGNRAVGSYRGGVAELTGLSANLGLLPRLGDIVPSSAPATSPLSTQVGLLNFNDGRGYLQASLEYTLLATGEALRTNVYGLEPFTLSFPQAVAPRRGESLTVNVAVDYEVTFSAVNLLDEPEAFVKQLIESLSITSVN